MYYASALTSELSTKQYGSSTIKGHAANPIDCQRRGGGGGGEEAVSAQSPVILTDLQKV